MRTKAYLAILTFLLVGVWIENAGAVSIDFNSLNHGEIVNTQFAASLGVTISAVNVGGGPDLAIIFDSSLSGSTADPDLQGPPWQGGNLAPTNTVLENMLIIAENDVDSNNDDLIDVPDDEGSQPAGSLFFDFNAPIPSFGFDLIDVEGPEEISNDSGFFATFYLASSELAQVGFGAFVDPASSFYDPTVVYGDNTANRISPITATQLGLTTQFDRVQISLGGSAAVDNVNWNQQPPHKTPEPATLVLLGSGLIGMSLLKMRQKRRRE